MIDGFYKVEFRTPLGGGGGVVTLANGVIHGGDSAIYYFGTYTVQGDHFVADAKTARHSNAPGMANVFGRDQVDIKITGTITGDRIEATGQSPQAPGVSFNAILSRLPV